MASAPYLLLVRERRTMAVPWLRGALKLTLLRFLSRAGFFFQRNRPGEEKIVLDVDVLLHVTVEGCQAVVKGSVAIAGIGRRRVILAELTDLFRLSVGLIVFENHHPDRVLHRAERRPGDWSLPINRFFNSQNVREQRLFLFEQVHREIPAHFEKECLHAFQFRMVFPVHVNNLFEKAGDPDDFLAAEHMVCSNNMLGYAAERFAIPTRR